MSSFYANELQTALAEQSFGIKSFSFASSTPHEANAYIQLLEGYSIIVRLTIQGYTIEQCKSGSPGNITFDSIENLLCSVSHLFEEKRHDAWASKLAQLLPTNKVLRSPSFPLTLLWEQVIDDIGIVSKFQML